MTGQNQKIGGGGFHHVAMRVKDFDASVRFYTQGLGFVEKMAWGQENHRAVMLDTGDGNYLELFAGGSPDPKPEGCLLHFALRTTQCDEAIEQARKAGAEITMEPKNVDIPSNPTTPVRIAFCKGPDGEVIEFFQHLDKS
ncbi:MAG: VOC family protein [Phycisphaerae bacterium]